MENLQFFDTHCHLDDDQFDMDRQALIVSLPEQGIRACVTVGSDLASSARCIALAHQYPFVYAAVGVHPHASARAEDDYLETLRGLAVQQRVVALGEIGLDYHYDFSTKDTQKKLLEEQLDLAYELHLPVILHVREAHGELIDLLRTRKDRLSGGIIHCYSGSAQSVGEYIRLGYMISFAGSITFKTAQKLREAAQAVPLDHLLIETDSPYLAPEPQRGKRNDPAKVKYICQMLADLRGMSAQDMAQLTLDNAMCLYGISL